jgi:hypothetical protein
MILAKESLTKIAFVGGFFYCKNGKDRKIFSENSQQSKHQKKTHVK